MPAILITGANQGVGHALVTAYARVGWQVIACVRHLENMPPVEGNVRLYKLDATSLSDAHMVAADLRTGNITLDVVVANAALSSSDANLIDIPIAVFDRTYQTNIRGPLVLFQAMKPILRDGGKFVIMASTHKTILPGHGDCQISKAAVDFLVKKLHVEHPEIVVIGLNPGTVATSMGDRTNRWDGITEARTPVSENIPGMLHLIEHATRADHSGHQVWFDGRIMP